MTAGGYSSLVISWTMTEGDWSVSIRADVKIIHYYYNLPHFRCYNYNLRMSTIVLHQVPYPMDFHNNIQVAYNIKLMGDVKEAAHHNNPTSHFVHLCTQCVVIITSPVCLLYICYLCENTDYHKPSSCLVSLGPSPDLYCWNNCNTDRLFFH